MGMDRHTGRPLEGLEHVEQSVLDVLSTVQGERVMRLSYGSRILESVADAGNPAGRSRLLGRIADPINAWEGDRVELQRVDVRMPTPGDVRVSVEGTTDLGRMLISDASIMPADDPRWPAHSIVYESPYLGTTTVGHALDVAIPLYRRLLTTAPWKRSTAYVEPQYDPVNAAAVVYQGRSVYSVLDEMFVNQFDLVHAIDFSYLTPPSIPNTPPVTDPVPNAAGIFYGWTTAGFYLGSLATALYYVEITSRGWGDDTFRGIVGAD